MALPNVFTESKQLRAFSGFSHEGKIWGTVSYLYRHDEYGCVVNAKLARMSRHSLAENISWSTAKFHLPRNTRLTSPQNFFAIQCATFIRCLHHSCAPHALIHLQPIDLKTTTTFLSNMTRNSTLCRGLCALGLLSMSSLPTRAEPLSISGIYPSIAYFNEEGECGTGAVVPWANRLWVATYGPHQPKGSTDKLYEIDSDLNVTIRPESIGGTPANRMIHRESNQLFISSYVIDSTGKVRVIPFSSMFGRMTGNARHLTDPAGKIYYATMEEGIYEVDVKTLQPTELFADNQGQIGHYDSNAKNRRVSNLPGYHGKGLYSGQGQLIYANNGETGTAAKTDPTTPSGVLGSWDGKSDKWNVVRRNQFTDVTGPGGIYGSNHPATDPVWSIGWDHRSLILMCLDAGKWHSYRLPKSSHSYDGAHGWNTEWPRIREIGEKDLLMTMHGCFWKFPADFSSKKSAGIQPRSNYLKVVGDFCRWNDRVVLGCDDTARSEFLSKRRAKGAVVAPQSQSNLWFLKPDQLDQLGPVIGRGGVWVQEDVAASAASDPYLFSGYDHRSLVISHKENHTVRLRLEVDARGNGEWQHLRDVDVAADAPSYVNFTSADRGAWIRLVAQSSARGVSAVFFYHNQDTRTNTAAPIFQGLATKVEASYVGGLVRALSDGSKQLGFAATKVDGTPLGYYVLDEKMQLVRRDDSALLQKHLSDTALPSQVLRSDAASVIFTDDSGKRWRLPKGESSASALTDYRICREVATERDMFNAAGSLYEMPADNAGGAAMMRPIASHELQILDFCSYRGLLIMSGLNMDSLPSNSHIIRSSDGKVALWAGVVDDIWKLGKPRGNGGPWMDSAVKANEPSDPYLMTGYDQKTLSLSANQAVTVVAEIDITGRGNWVRYRNFNLAPGKTETHPFDPAFSAYWIRFTAKSPATVTAQLKYQ